MRAWFAVLALMAVAMPAAAEMPDSDPAAVAVADRVMTALGGHDRWDKLCGLRWTFGSAVHDTVRSPRHHAWDKQSGWHRVEGKNRQGQSYCIMHKVGETTGKAWVDGVALEGDSLAKMVKLSQSLWTNDGYWFLMPYKLRDPGVTLKYVGEVKDTDRTYDQIALNFTQVGETPGDRYWVFVNRANDRIEKWEFVLQGNEPPPVQWTWEAWEEHDGLWFPTAHVQEARTIFTRDVATLSAFPPETFTTP